MMTTATTRTTTANRPAIPANDLGNDEAAQHNRLLRLSILSCPIEASGLRIILEHSLTSPSLETLSLINVDAKGTEAGDAIGTFLSSLPNGSAPPPQQQRRRQDTHVCNLELRSNALGVDGSKALAQGLWALRSSVGGFSSSSSSSNGVGLLRLDLASCALEDYGGAAILMALSSSSSSPGTNTNASSSQQEVISLQELYLDDNNLGVESFQALTRFLVSPGAQLKTLSLNENPNLFRPTVSDTTRFNRILGDWKYGLEQNKSLKRIFLERTGLSCAMIGSNQRDLNMRPCIYRLFQALQRNKTIQSLNVKRNTMPNDSLAKLLLSTVPLWMGCCDIAVTIGGSSWASHIPSLARAFEKNLSLVNVTLDLDDDEDVLATEDQEGGENSNGQHYARAARTIEQEFTFHQQLNCFRKRNRELWQIRTFCERQVQKGNRNSPIWALAMQRLEHDESMYYSISCFFS